MQFVSYDFGRGCKCFGLEDNPVSLTDMVGLCASTGQAKGCSSKNRRGQEKGVAWTVSTITNAANFRLLKKVLSYL